jgi:hypothetical protein
LLEGHFFRKASSMIAQPIRWFFLLAPMPACEVAGAQETRDFVVPESVPLPDDELSQITVSLLQRYPQLAGSPGVKSAGAYLGDGSDLATVIYYPHVERRGIREAVEAHCRRAEREAPWACDEVWSRRYLQLASQTFEVRLLAGIPAEAAFALIEASRRDLDNGAGDASTAIMITAHHEEPRQYFIGWGTPDGVLTLTMLAQLEHDGDPANPDAWHASIYEPSAQE